MKKIIALQLFLLLTSPLFASYYSSNILAQQKGSLDVLSPVGYVLEVKDNTETLYLDGKSIQKTTYLEDKEIIVNEDCTETKEFSPNGTLLSHTIETDSLTQSYLYEYTANDILKRIVKSENQEIKEITLVNYSSLAGLTSIVKNEEISYFNDDFYLYSKDDTNVLIDASIPSILVKSTSKAGEENNQEIIYEGDDFFVRESYLDTFIDTYYLSDGKVKEIIERDASKAIISSTSYHYDKGYLVAEIFTKGSEERTTTYVDKKAAKTILKIDGVITSEFIYNDDLTTTEFRYRDYKPYVEILYDFDGISVLDVVVL